MNLRRRFLTLALGLLWVAPAAVADEGAVLPLMERAAGWQPANPDRWKTHEHAELYFADRDAGKTAPAKKRPDFRGSEMSRLAPK